MNSSDQQYIQCMTDCEHNPGPRCGIHTTASMADHVKIVETYSSIGEILPTENEDE